MFQTIFYTYFSATYIFSAFFSRFHNSRGEWGTSYGNRNSALFSIDMLPNLEVLTTVMAVLLAL